MEVDRDMEARPETPSGVEPTVEVAAEAEVALEAGSEPGAQQEDEGIAALLREGTKWYLTALLVFLLAAGGVIIYLSRVRSMDFYHALF